MHLKKKFLQLNNNTLLKNLRGKWLLTRERHELQTKNFWK